MLFGIYLHSYFTKLKLFCRIFPLNFDNYMHIDQTKFTSLEKEKRIFKPKADFSRNAHIRSMAQYKKMYNESVKNPQKFWARIADELHWFKKWKKVLEWKL